MGRVMKERTGPLRSGNLGVFLSWDLTQNPDFYALRNLFLEMCL